MVKENTLLYEMLSEWSTDQLDERLAQEIHKETVDEETVRTILAILREREEPVEITPQIQSAWEKYQKDSASIPKVKPKRIPTGLLRAASICIVVVLLFSLIPTNAQADNFWERVVRWTNEIFESFNPHAKKEEHKPYVFKTDHPGLQKVYDTVAEFGITEPVVPMWLPEDYLLTEICSIEELDYQYIHSMFSNEDSYAIIDIRKYSSIAPGQYEKNNTEVETVEMQGIIHYLFNNMDSCIATWSKDSLECCIIVDDQENIMYDILRSIYTTEGKE